ncbi:MAG: ABC transporter ATP-binding protein [Clostridiales bacterium]|nr:ABC transporter ATP-binding protein [Clostridiales bacterium]
MLKVLLKSVREYKTPSILTPVVMVGEAAMEIVIPFIMTFLLGQIELMASGEGDIGMVLLYGAIMLVAALFSLVCGALGAKLASKASAGFAHNLREDMYKNLQAYSFENIDKFSTASLITRITTDVANVQQAYQMCIRMLVRAPILFIFATIMSFIMEPSVAVIFVAAAILLGIAISFGMLKVIPYFKTMFKKYDDLNSVVQENLTAVRVVKSFVREDYEIEKIKKASGELKYYSVKAEKLLTLLMPAVNLVMYTTIIILLIIGANMSILGTGNIHYTDLQALITYATQILSGVMMVAMCVNFLTLSKGSIDRIGEVLQEIPTLNNPENAITEVKDGSIEFDDVDFAYSQKADLYVLKDITLSIKSGETIGIIGATGSGKTSLVSLIPRLYDVSQGSVKVGGVDVREYDMQTLRNNVAMVLQKNVLFSGSIAENLRWGDENATEEDLRLAARQASAEEFIDNLPGGFNYDLGQGGVNVSGGQKQRLCIARAMLKKPKVIIFDDSTSAVDTKTDASIRSALKQYAPNTTKIIIAQRIASVIDADRIIVLDDGRISAVGTHSELINSSSIYNEVYQSQARGGVE